MERVYSVSTKRFIGANGRVTALELVKVEMALENGRSVLKEIPGSEFQLPVNLALLAMGFVSPEKPGMLEKLGVKLTERGNVWRDAN